MPPHAHLKRGNIAWVLGSSPSMTIGGYHEAVCALPQTLILSLSKDEGFRKRVQRLLLPPPCGEGSRVGVARRAKQRVCNLSANIEFVAPPHPTRLCRATLPIKGREKGACRRLRCALLALVITAPPTRSNLLVVA